jgi:hypothetical protein
LWLKSPARWRYLSMTTRGGGLLLQFVLPDAWRSRHPAAAAAIAYLLGHLFPAEERL